jgi:hypothetical protein
MPKISQKNVLDERSLTAQQIKTLDWLRRNASSKRRRLSALTAEKVQRPEFAPSAWTAWAVMFLPFGNVHRPLAPSGAIGRIN